MAVEAPSLHPTSLGAEVVVPLVLQEVEVEEEWVLQEEVVVVVE